MNHSTKKLTIEYIKNFIKENHFGFKLLSDNYIDITNPLLIKCSKGHVFERSFYDIKRNILCDICKKENNIKQRNEEILETLKKKHPEAKLISKYTGYKKKFKIQCEKGHIFDIELNNFRSGKWCKQCNKPDITIDYINSFIKDKYNGKCLNENFISQIYLMTFNCKKNHTFKRTWQSVRSGRWCTHYDCAKAFKPNIEFIKKFVKEKYNGVCLSEEYIKSEYPLRVKCKEGHEWNSCWNYLNSGVWCPKCSGVKRKTLEEINFYIFEKYGGKCLSTKYKNNRQKLQFECIKGHKWKTTWHIIYSSKCWCPACSEGFGERFCRFVFENIFNKKFPNTKPEWLLTEEGNNMELDGFCKELNLAFEYDGRQHKEIVKTFKMTKSDLERRKKLDNLKDKLCKENKIILIRIPQFNKKFTKFNLIEFLEKKFLDIGIEFNKNIDVNEFYKL